MGMKEVKINVNVPDGFRVVGLGVEEYDLALQPDGRVFRSSTRSPHLKVELLPGFDLKTAAFSTYVNAVKKPVKVTRVTFEVPGETTITNVVYWTPTGSRLVEFEWEIVEK